MVMRLVMSEHTMYTQAPALAEGLETLDASLSHASQGAERPKR